MDNPDKSTAAQNNDFTATASNDSVVSEQLSGSAVSASTVASTTGSAAAASTDDDGQSSTTIGGGDGSSVSVVKPGESHESATFTSVVHGFRMILLDMLISAIRFIALLHLLLCVISISVNILTSTQQYRVCAAQWGDVGHLLNG